MAGARGANASSACRPHALKTARPDARWALRLTALAEPSQVVLNQGAIRFGCWFDRIHGRAADAAPGYAEASREAFALE
jgi:hypothetical protein